MGRQRPARLQPAPDPGPALPGAQPGGLSDPGAVQRGPGGLADGRDERRPVRHQPVVHRPADLAAPRRQRLRGARGRTHEEYLRHVLRVHSGDILRFQPDFVWDPGADGQHAFVVQRGDGPVGVVLLEADGDTARVRLDYVTPRFRDFSPGEFVCTAPERGCSRGWASGGSSPRPGWSSPTTAGWASAPTGRRTCWTSDRGSAPRAAVGAGRDPAVEQGSSCAFVQGCLRAGDARGQELVHRACSPS